MKLWTIVDLTRLPFIFSEGLTNPSYEEIIFESSPEMIADSALSAREEAMELGKGEYFPAFIEVDFPDDEINTIWFTACMASNYDRLTDERGSLEAMVSEGQITEEQFAEEMEQLALVEEALGNNDMITVFETMGFACLYTVVPPEMIKVLDPETMLEAVFTEDEQAIMEAAQMSEARGLESMGGGFWVWLIMFMAGLFGPGWSEKAEAEEATRKAEGRRRRRKGRKKKAKKRAPRKKKRKPKSRKVTS